MLQNKKSPDVSTVGFYIIIESKSLFLKKDIFLLTFVGIEAIPLFKCKMADKVQVKALKGFEEAPGGGDSAYEMGGDARRLA